MRITVEITWECRAVTPADIDNWNLRLEYYEPWKLILIESSVG